MESMKILSIQNARIPTEKAHGIQIMKMCEAFASQGVEVGLVLPKRFNSINQDPFEYYGVERIFTIKKLPCLDLIPFDKYLGRFAFWVEVITFSFSALFYVFLRKPNIIYTRNDFFSPFSPLLRNLFFEIHGISHQIFLPFFKKITGIIAISKHLKDSLSQKGIPEEKILVAPSGVDLEKFNIKETQEDCRRKLSLPLDKKVVLYAGHLYEWKGADILAKASQYLDSNSVVVLVGGTKRDIEEFRIKNQELRNILIVGHKPHPEIPYWLKAAEVLVLPSLDRDIREKYWTSPLKLFEYMGAKRPIVASDLPSIKEILNENNAVLVKPDDPEDLAKGIKEVLQNQGLANRLVVQAFSDVQSYTWKRRAKNILEFIEKKKI